MIEVHNLTKEYGTYTAIQNVSFKVEKGQILGLLGPNGAGKTTTMRILTGYMPASAGTAMVAGFDVFEQSLEVRRRIGYLPETPPLYPEMTVLGYLDFVAKLKGVSKTERKARIDSVITKCWLEGVTQKLCQSLSKGYKQRVGLAAALVHDPEVLILDEPTSGLDPKQINETRQLIRSLAGQHTVVLSTHILPEVEMTCQTVVIINKGTVVAQDSPDNLKHRLQGGSHIALKVRGPQNEVEPLLKDIPGVLAVTQQGISNGTTQYMVETQAGESLTEKIAASVVHRDFGLLELRPVDASLEEIFLKLTTQEEVTA